MLDVMPELVHQRCQHHSLREAVARCPECARFYCRECVTEHEDRVLCASCLRALLQRPEQTARPSRLWLGAQLACSLVAAWFFFYLIGQVLLSLDSSFHEGTLWRETFSGE
jgi:hypothetical protein